MKEYNESEIRNHYHELTDLLIERGLTITTMESATSGQLASLITDTEGSSAVLKGAFVTYCNEAKILQGVPAEILERYTVYSGETAEAMEPGGIGTGAGVFCYSDAGCQGGRSCVGRPRRKQPRRKQPRREQPSERPCLRYPYVLLLCGTGAAADAADVQACGGRGDLSGADGEAGSLLM